MFGVRHYAGDVAYHVDGFLDKNRDALPQELQDVMHASSNALFSTWFAPAPVQDETVSTASLFGPPSPKSSAMALNEGALSPTRNGTLGSGSLMRKKNAKFITIGYQFNVGGPD